MNLKKIRSEIDSLRLRLAAIRPTELTGLAIKLGRRRDNRGKEPTFVKPGRFPISIPIHPGTLKRGTARNILDQLENDLIDLEIRDNANERDLEQAIDPIDPISSMEPEGSDEDK